MALNGLYVIIPAYNEGTSIKKVIDQFQGTDAKVVVVNDGSKDNTSRVLEKSGAIVLNHIFNIGQGAALQTGIEYAVNQDDCEFVGTFDADGQHRVEDLTKMYKTMKRNKTLDIVLGSRFIGTIKTNLPPFKRVVLRTGTKLMNAISGIKLTDTHNGLRLMTKAFAGRLDIQSPDMVHASEILIKIAGQKAMYKEVPIEVIYTDYSKAKGQSIINSINIIFDVLVNKYLVRT